MLCARKQDLVVIRMIDAPQCLDQFASIPPEPDARIFKMPGGDNDLHNVAMKCTTVAETECP